MDPKGTAKSKRSHTLHGKKNSPHTSFAHNADKKKNLQQKHQQKPQGIAGDKPRLPTRPSLPSNWDRYEEEYGDFDHDGLEDSAPLRTFDDGTVVPKSKGADFAELVEKARSRVVEDGFDSRFDASVPDYIQDLSPMLLTRGNSLMLNLEDDSFFVDDEVSTSFEVPFLSLDLDALSKQLAKLKTSQRLFIDPMYTREEMERASKTFPQEPELKQSSSEPQHMPNLLPVKHGGYSGDERNITHHDDNASTSTGGHETEEKTSLLSDLSVVNKNKLDQDKESQEHAASFDQQMNPKSEWNAKSKYEIASAEGELNLLLDSFSVVKPFTFPAVSTSSSNNSVSWPVAHNISSQTSGLHPAKESSSTKSAYLHTVSLDTTVDDLLSDVAPIYSSSDKTTKSASGSTFPSLKSSRSLHGTGAIDEAIDNLLAETLSCAEEQKQSRQRPTGTEVRLSDATVTASPSVTKALDDFDSWFDTL